MSERSTLLFTSLGTWTGTLTSLLPLWSLHKTQPTPVSSENVTNAPRPRMQFSAQYLIAPSLHLAGQCLAHSTPVRRVPMESSLFAWSDSITHLTTPENKHWNCPHLYAGIGTEGKQLPLSKTASGGDWIWDCTMLLPQDGFSMLFPRQLS